MTKPQVVIGGAGGLGSAIVKQLAHAKQPVRAVVRTIDERARKLAPSSAELVKGDALDIESVRQVCKDASIIYHTANVPYRKWEELMPTITENVLGAAAESGARVVFPGNVYVYGKFEGKPATEEHPFAATSRKGKLRVELERQLMDAHRAGAAAGVVIPRFPDYYGPNVMNRLFAPIFVAAISGGKASWIGSLDVPHDLVYIDDAARACVLLGSTEDAYGQVWHVPGAGPTTGRKFIEMAFQATGRKANIGLLGSKIIRLAAVFNSDARQMTELLYEFDEPLLLDGSKFARRFPSFKFTPHEVATALTVEWFRRQGGTDEVADPDSSQLPHLEVVQ